MFIKPPEPERRFGALDSNFAVSGCICPLSCFRRGQLEQADAGRQAGRPADKCTQHTHTHTHTQFGCVLQGHVLVTHSILVLYADIESGSHNRYLCAV